MKHSLIIFFSLLLLHTSVYSQNDLEKALLEIENNNTSLNALRKSADAEILMNKTGIFLQNPEFEFNYLWGSPSVIGNRTGVSIQQSFDFPSAYRFRKEISETKNNQVELEYVKQEKTILLEARLICIDLIHNNAFRDELSKRVSNAQKIADSYQSKYKLGEANILEYNKSQFTLINLQNDLESLDIEQNNFLSKLVMLNGGKNIEFNTSHFEILDIPLNFDEWYAFTEKNNPVLKWLRQEVEIEQNQEKLSKAMSLPKFQTGYMSEVLSTEAFRGITVGFSIPMWENKNTVKFAKAKIAATESIELDAKIQFYNELKALHSVAVNLQKSVKNYRNNLETFDNSELLKKALDKGEISLINYILELSVYYESANKLIDLERDMQKTYAHLMKFM